MRGSSLARAVALGLGLLFGPAAGAEAPPTEPPRLELELARREGTVGDLMPLRILVDLPPGTRLEPTPLGPEIGPFRVADGSWSGPSEEAGRERWTWSGNLVSFRTGELELPPILLRVASGEGEASTVESASQQLRIRSVLEPEKDQGELADLKPPALIAANYRALLGGLAILLVLLAASAVLWWLHRRYASRLAAVPVPDDPFHRTPPDVWVYAELQRLLDQRLAEAGRFELFYSELSRILKRYLSGRFRVELMERTTSEVSDRLVQAGTAADGIHSVVELLLRCDMVKFAREPTQSADCRAAIEQAYRIVDATKSQPVSAEVVRSGAA